MRIETLDFHIQRLVRLKRSTAPLISLTYYFDSGRSPREAISRGLMTLEGVDMPARAEQDFKKTVKRLLEYLDQLPAPRPVSVAVYARGGDNPFFLGLPLQVPLPLRFIVGSRPDIYHLIEARERYHRYLALVLNHRVATILEVNLGAIVSRVPVPRTEIPHQAAHQWPADGSSVFREDSTRDWFERCFRRLERMIAGGKYQHLILAGNSHLAWQFRHSLPYGLSVKFFDLIDTSGVRGVAEIVATTTDAYVQKRQETTHAMVNEFFQGGAPEGSIVTGFNATREALRSGSTEALLLSRSSGAEHRFRRDLVLSAARRGCRILFLDNCMPLNYAGGVCCILRTTTPSARKQQEGVLAVP